MISFGELAASLERAAIECRPRLEVTLAAEMIAVAEYIKEHIIGIERGEWPPLSQRTIDLKTRLGYVGHRSATDPLLRTGALRESIVGGAEGLTGIVTTPDPYAREHELGSSREPPRPFLSLGMAELAPAIHEAFNVLAVELLTPGGVRP